MRKFELTLSGHPLNGDQFGIILRAAHGKSFRDSGGDGDIELSCSSEVKAGTPPLIYHLSIGRGTDENPPVARRRSAVHDFADHKVSRIAGWSFREVVEDSSKTFVVFLEISAFDYQ